MSNFCFRDKRRLPIFLFPFYNWFLASKVLRDMHRYEDEIVCLKKAFQIDNKSYYCLNGMGWAYVNLYQFQQGLQCFEGVLNFDKFNQNALKGRAVCLEKLEPRRPLNPNQNPVNKNKDEGLLKKIFPFFK